MTLERCDLETLRIAKNVLIFSPSSSIRYTKRDVAIRKGKQQTLTAVRERQTYGNALSDHGNNENMLSALFALFHHVGHSEPYSTQHPRRAVALELPASNRPLSKHHSIYIPYLKYHLLSSRRFGCLYQ